MNGVLTFISGILYFLVGAIALIMAIKNLAAKKFLPFHEKSAGKQWDEIDQGIKLVILSIMKVSGLGFMVVAIMLLIYPVVMYLSPGSFVKYSFPGLSLVYCSGLFFVNFQLYKRTGAPAPWKGSLYAIGIILLGLILSILL